MSDWAALDVTAAVAWMRQRYSSLPLTYVGHSFGGQALGLLPNNADIRRALLIASLAASWKLLASPERYRAYALLKFAGLPLTRALADSFHLKHPDTHVVVFDSIGDAGGVQAAYDDVIDLGLVKIDPALRHAASPPTTQTGAESSRIGAARMSQVSGDTECTA